MKFILTATRSTDIDFAALGAVRENVVREAQTRTDVSWYKEHVWMSQGINHRVENGIAYREHIDSEWVIEIATLEELLDLMCKCDQELVINKVEGTGMYGIEIYNDYRE